MISLFAWFHYFPLSIHKKMERYYSSLLNANSNSYIVLLIHFFSIFLISVGKTSLITRFMYDSFDNTYQVFIIFSYNSSDYMAIRHITVACIYLIYNYLLPFSVNWIWNSSMSAMYFDKEYSQKVLNYN